MEYYLKITKRKDNDPFMKQCVKFIVFINVNVFTYEVERNKYNL